MKLADWPSDRQSLVSNPFESVASGKVDRQGMSIALSVHKLTLIIKQRVESEYPKGRFNALFFCRFAQHAAVSRTLI